MNNRGMASRGVRHGESFESLIWIKVSIPYFSYGHGHNHIRREQSMTGGETWFLIGVIAAFVAFSAMLAYSQITSGGPKP